VIVPSPPSFEFEDPLLGRRVLQRDRGMVSVTGDEVAFIVGEAHSVCVAPNYQYPGDDACGTKCRHDRGTKVDFFLDEREPDGLVRPCALWRWNRELGSR
jgi:hypothetical protein